MSNKQPEEPKHIGYSNGKAYPLYAVKSDNRGLCDIEGWAWPVWCTFERIESIETENPKNTPTP